MSKLDYPKRHAGLFVARAIAEQRAKDVLPGEPQGFMRPPGGLADLRAKDIAAVRKAIRKAKPKPPPKTKKRG